MLASPRTIIHENYMRETTCGGLQHSVVAAGDRLELTAKRTPGETLSVVHRRWGTSQIKDYNGVDVNQELCANLFDARCLPDVGERSILLDMQEVGKRP